MDKHNKRRGRGIGKTRLSAVARLGVCGTPTTMRRKEVFADAYVARDMGTSSNGKVRACDVGGRVCGGGGRRGHSGG